MSVSNESVSPLSSRCSSPTPVLPPHQDPALSMNPVSTTPKTTHTPLQMTPPQTVVVVPSHRKSRSLIGFDPLLDDKRDVTPPSKKDLLSLDQIFSQALTATPSTAASTASRPPKPHRNSTSLGANDFGSILSRTSRSGDSKRDSKVGRGMLLGRKTNSVRMGRGHRKTQSLGGNEQPLRNVFAADTSKSTPSTPHNLSPVADRPVMEAKHIDLPLLAKPSPTSFLGVENYYEKTLRSSEQDPAPHQVEIPSAEDLHVHAKMCALMEEYRKTDQNFDFGSLVGIPRRSLQEFLSLNKSVGKLVPAQKPIVNKLLAVSNNAIFDVAGYFSTATAEAAVFDGQHRIVVVFRGTDALQHKPVNPKQARHVTVQNNLHPDQKVTVFPSFREAYFALETPLCALLDRLMDQNPFCEVVFAGHSFGAALATLAGARFASVRPVVRVSCHLTASPRVGTANFRRWVHTLPNLKVMRVECGNGPEPAPVDSSSHAWLHVGHTLSLSTKTIAMKAYRFDKCKPSANRNHYSKHDVVAYTNALQPFVKGPDQQALWEQEYQQENIGYGVRGRNNEKRLVV